MADINVLPSQPSQIVISSPTQQSLVVPNNSISITQVSQQGLPGPPGPKGNQNLFIQPTQPSGNLYFWVQTGMGQSGRDFTLWFEDGT